jgi:4'-phosphopantetheinyl transferase EntD
MWSMPLSPREAQCVEKAVPKRRHEFQAGRAAARAALRLLGIEDFDLISGAHREPLWPAGVVGSITHSGERCAAAVASQTRITSLGIDLESEEELAADLMAMICSDVEQEMLRLLPERNPTFWAKVVFSAKEAFFKAYFPQTQTFLDFQDVTIALHPSRGEFDVLLINRDVPSLFGSRRATGRYGINDGYVHTAVSTIA